MIDETLLPCPFCGGEPKLAKKYVYCGECGGSGGAGEPIDEDDEAVALWNRRVVPAGAGAAPAPAQGEPALWEHPDPAVRDSQYESQYDIGSRCGKCGRVYYTHVCRATPPAAPTMRRDPDIDRILSEPGVLEKLYDDAPAAPAPAQGIAEPIGKLIDSLADLQRRFFDGDAERDRTNLETMLMNIAVALKVAYQLSAPPQPSPAVGQEPWEEGVPPKVMEEAYGAFVNRFEATKNRVKALRAAIGVALRSAHTAPAAVGQADAGVVNFPVFYFSGNARTGLCSIYFHRVPHFEMPVLLCKIKDRDLASRLTTALDEAWHAAIQGSKP